MKKRILEAAILLLVLGVLGYFTLNLDSTKRPSPKNDAASLDVAIPDKSNGVAASPSAAANIAEAKVTSPDGRTALAAAPNSIPATPEVSSLPPLTVLDNARVAMKNYGSTFGENPVGTNPEITAALTGKNPKGINFITAESGLRVNEQGEMVDGYGSPLFFHQISGREMEIRSAGEDRKMWTFDDLVTR